MEPIDMPQNTCASSNKWIKVYDAIDEKEWLPNAATFGLKNMQMLEVVGEKANLRQERRLDAQYKRYMATLLLQRVVRGFLGR